MKHNSNNKFHDPLLKHVRKVAFEDFRIEAARTLRKAERLRDDQGLIDAAEVKRQRKAAKIAAQLKKEKP